MVDGGYRDLNDCGLMHKEAKNMNSEELFKRTKDVLNPSLARKETWTFVGVGSGGGRDAEEAARFGIGTIFLVDRPDERLEEHNIIRHPLGYRDLGRLKTEALRDHLLNINPECCIEAVAMDVVEDIERLREVIGRSTQVHLGTDNEASKHVVNELAVKAGVPLIFAGVFDGGCGGEVGRVLPGGACYACIAGHLNRSARLDEGKGETFDYSRPESMQKSTAALNLDILQIALLQARVGLLTMRAKEDPSGDLPGNYVLFGNRAVEGLFPRMLSSDIWTIPKNPQCMICNRYDMSDAAIDSAAQAILSRAVCKPAEGL